VDVATSAVGEVIRDFICTELDYRPDEVADETPLFSSGMVDSFTFVSLIALIETRLKVRLDPGHITVENFDSIGRIVAFLDSTVQREPSWEPQ